MLNRIQVYTDMEMKRRVELAAAKQNIPITEYCLTAIRQQLAEDEVLEEAHITIPVNPKDTDETLLDDLRMLREKILKRRGKPIDIDTIIEQTHEERDKDLLDLH